MRDPGDWTVGEPLELSDTETDVPMQVGTAVSAETGRVIVLVRFGNHVAAMTPRAAQNLADALQAEAMIAGTTGFQDA